MQSQVQGGGRDPGLASDAIAQKFDGHIRFEIPLNRLHPVQDNQAHDAHDGGRRPLSSRNDTSRVRCDPFLTPQWPRTSSSSIAAFIGWFEMW